MNCILFIIRIHNIFFSYYFYNRIPLLPLLPLLLLQLATNTKTQFLKIYNIGMKVGIATMTSQYDELEKDILILQNMVSKMLGII